MKGIAKIRITNKDFADDELFEISRIIDKINDIQANIENIQMRQIDKFEDIQLIVESIRLNQLSQEKKKGIWQWVSKLIHSIKL